MLKKRWLSFVLALAMVLVGVGCSNNNGNGASDDTTAPAESVKEEIAAETVAETDAEIASETKAEETGERKTDYVIATVPKLTAAAWFVRMEEGIKDFAAATGVEAYMTGPEEADAAMQAQYIQDLIAQGVDAICVVPYSMEALEPVLKQARDAGIVIIAHEGEGLKNVDYDIEAFDNDEYGEHLLERIAQKTDGKGDYVVSVGSLTGGSQMQWAEAGIAYQKANYPDMNLTADIIESQDMQEQAYQKVKEVITANPNLAGFQGGAMQDVAGAAMAVDEAGLSGKVVLVGTSLVSVSGKYIKEGTIDMISFWDPALAGYAMNELALKVLNGEEIADGTDLGLDGYDSLTLDGNVLKGKAWIDVDAENVDDPAFDF